MHPALPALLDAGHIRINVILAESQSNYLNGAIINKSESAEATPALMAAPEAMVGPGSNLANILPTATTTPASAPEAEKTSIRTRKTGGMVVMIQAKDLGFHDISTFAPEPNIGTGTTGTNLVLLRNWLCSWAKNLGIGPDLRGAFPTPFVPVCDWIWICSCAESA
jgi:hypothetical protein